MKKWLLPGAGVLAAVAAIAVFVVVVASPFDSDDTAAKTASDTAIESGDPNGGVSNAVCAPGFPNCNDMIVGGGADDTSDPGRPVSDEANDAVASGAAVRTLAERLNIDAKTIDVVSNEPTEWPNACLGVEKPDVLCAQVITPGFKVLLMANGTQYEYHTDTTGTAIFSNSTPLFVDPAY